MTAVTQATNNPVQIGQDLIDQIWLQEERLSDAHKNVAMLEHIAADFVSFDAQGNPIAKSDYIDCFVPTGEANLTRLWGHFGSDHSCCLAYLKQQGNGVVNICMALWIECDGAWLKTFHHQNEKFG